MNPTTQPSDGAVRAANQIAKEALDRLGTSKVVGTMFHNDVAAEIIDQETGAGELVEAAQTVLWALDESKTDCIGKGFLRHILSRHTSTQGKEGKL